MITVATGLDSPNGVAFRNGSLYVAEIGRIPVGVPCNVCEPDDERFGTILG